MDWNELRKSVYRIDGSLRDIYVLNTTRADWSKWSDYVSVNYQVSWYAEDYNDGVSVNRVDSSFIDHRWDSEQYVTTASIFLNKTQINCHFFIESQIENDIDPKEVESLDDHNMVVDYMKSISKLLGKEVILTEENNEEAIWIKVAGDEVCFFKL